MCLGPLIPSYVGPRLYASPGLFDLPGEHARWMTSSVRQQRASSDERIRHILTALGPLDDARALHGTIACAVNEHRTSERQLAMQTAL